MGADLPAPVGPVLVCGFGPFLEIADNPAAALARAVDGVLLSDGTPIVGRVMTVSYTRAPQETRAWVAALRPRALVGIGVARGRARVCVETRGTRLLSDSSPDAEGVARTEMRPDGPDDALLSAPAQALADALGAVVSDDAGRYVCNGWIYEVALDLAAQIPCTFIHIPPSSLAPQILCSALDRLWGGRRTPP